MEVVLPKSVWFSFTTKIPQITKLNRLSCASQVRLSKIHPEYSSVIWLTSYRKMMRRKSIWNLAILISSWLCQSLIERECIEDPACRSLHLVSVFSWCTRGFSGKWKKGGKSWEFSPAHRQQNFRTLPHAFIPIMETVFRAESIRLNGLESALTFFVLKKRGKKYVELVVFLAISQWMHICGWSKFWCQHAYWRTLRPHFRVKIGSTCNPWIVKHWEHYNVRTFIVINGPIAGSLWWPFSIVVQ